MGKTLHFIALLLFYPVVFCIPKDTPKKVILPPVVCYGTGIDSHVKISPPENALLKSANILNQNVTFDVTFSGFTTNARAAFNYALSIWSLYFQSSVNVRIYAAFETLGANILGSASPTGFYYDFEGAKPGVLYPVALAEKILQEDINGTEEYDIEISVSDDANIWYFGTDGNTPSGKYDFVTVMLHEIAHGLGFIGTMKLNSSNLGMWGLFGERPAVFDLYVQNNNQQQLINTTIFNNPSVLLKTQYTSNNLYFHSVVSLIKNPSYNDPRLYAPTIFNQGSSIYHLNDVTYPDGNINSLMTHATGTAEAIHNPGPLAVNMLEEMGWSFTYIEHTPLKDTEDSLSSIVLDAVINSDDPPASPKNYLVYSSDNFLTSDSVLMWQNGTINQFRADITQFSYNTSIQYLIKSYDFFGRKFTSPSNGPYHNFFIRDDTIKPTIQHFAPAYHTIDIDTLQLVVVAEDNLGIDSVYIQYYINEDIQDDLILEFDPNSNNYKGTINFSEHPVMVFDTVYYKITAIDKSKNKNIVFYPSNEYLKFSIEPEPKILTEYSQNFNTYSMDFFGTYSKSLHEDLVFNISTPEDFLDGCLHTFNPYKSPGKNNAEYNYIAQLRHKIILNENGGVLFDEVVLVEPGDDGYSFGTARFWDYVIVEGSKDNGKNWYNFIPGYDSNKDQAWLTTFTSSFDTDDNSTAKGFPGLYKSHYFSMLTSNDFKTGDTVLIRFRLYSDPYVYAWGWAIDNLLIQGNAGYSGAGLSRLNFDIYPNPANNVVNLKYELTDYLDISYSIIDMYGREILSDIINSGSGPNFKTIDVSNLNSGFYFIIIENNSGRLVKKILISH